MAKVSLVYASILIAFLSVSPAQSPPNQPSLLVNVLDRNGHPIQDLSRDSFRVKVNGHPTALLDAHYSLGPRRIVVLLDMSGSMRGVTDNKKWHVAREAVADLLADTPKQVQVALVTFSSHVREAFDFSQGRSSIAAWLKNGPSQQNDIEGKTALYDAVAEAAKLLEPALPGDAIYAITDGGENSSHASESNIKERLLESHIRLFVLLFDERSFRVEENSPPKFVTELARDTGGFVFDVPARHYSFAASYDFDYLDDKNARDRLDLYTKSLNTQISGFYNLQLDTPPSAKSSNVSITVVDSSGKPRKEVTWTCQRDLPPGGK
ncbi:MAG: VWA domain-containing protein [Terriglobales bacterium]